MEEESIEEKQEIGLELTRQDKRPTRWSRRNPGLHCSIRLLRERVLA